MVRTSFSGAFFDRGFWAVPKNEPLGLWHSTTPLPTPQPTQYLGEKVDEEQRRRDGVVERPKDGHQGVDVEAAGGEQRAKVGPRVDLFSGFVVVWSFGVVFGFGFGGCV
jgi:hypothetical protein